MTTAAKLTTILTLAIALVVATRPSQAQTVRYVNTTATGANSGISWADAYTNLQTALTAAASGDHIWAATGTFYPTDGTVRTAVFALKTDLHLYGGFRGNENTITQRAGGTNALTILSGDIGTAGVDADNCNTVVRAPSTATGALIDGFIITKASGANRGGGMQVFTTMTVRNCVFIDNQSTDGSGVQNGDRAAGGGMGEFPSSSLFDRCIFVNNAATARGGAFQSYNAGSAPVIQNCLFYGNSAGRGGAMSLYHSPSITVVNCTFDANSATDQGAAMYVSNAGGVVNRNCIFWDAGAHGGGIWVKSSTANPSESNFALSVDVTYSDVNGGFNPPAGGTGSNNINNDPLFVNAAARDYHLTVLSPCHDTASATGAPAQDLNGGTRPVGAGYDMGAYEFGTFIPGSTPVGLTIIAR